MEREEFPFALAPVLIQEFVRVHQKATESPNEFLATSGLFAGSVLAGRWFEFNGQFLNNNYLIVGSTGTAKKTTAQALSIKLLTGIKMVNLRQKYNQIKSSENEEPLSGSETAYPIVTHFSIEGLQSKAIGDGTSTAIQMGEYGTLFAIEKRQSQQNTITELTNMYDGNPISIKMVSRDVCAENYAISIFGASTKSWIEEFCSGKNIIGGFVNRHLVITGKPLRILPKPTQPSQKEWSDIVQSFSELIPDSLYPRTEEGKIKWSAEKKVLFFDIESEFAWTHYYQVRTEEVRSLKSSQLIELSARELTHAIKLAGLSAFLDKRTFVSLRDLEFGIRLSRWAVQNIITMAIEEHNFKSESAIRVVNKIKKSGPMSKTDLARALGGKQREINRAIGHLILDEMLEDCPDGLLRLTSLSSNSQSNEICKYFGKTDTYGVFKKSELEVGRGVSDKGCIL